MALVREASMDLQAPPASPVLLDRTASPVPREKEVLLARRGKAGPLASRGLRAVPGLRVPLVPPASRVNVGVLGVLALLASLAVVVLLVLLVIMVTQGPLAPVVLQARTGPPAPLAAMVLPVALGCLDLKVTLASPERRDHLAPRALRELQALWDLPGLPERGVSQDPRACRALGEAQAHRAPRVKVGNQDLLATMESVVLLAPRAFLVWPAQLVNLEEMETQDQMVFQAETGLPAARVIVEKMALPVPLVLLAIQAPLVPSVQLERVGTEEKRALLVLLVLQALLVPEVLQVPKVHVATKVKPVNVARPASRDTEDFPVVRAPRVPQVPPGTKVLSVAQDPQAPEDPLDPVAPLAKMARVGIRAPSDHQGREVTEENGDPRAPQATLDNRAHLDLLVPLAHAAVVGLLPWVLLEEVKKLVVLPRITEMNQWTSKSTLRRS